MGEMKIFQHSHKLENFKTIMISYQVSKTKPKPPNQNTLMYNLIYMAHNIF